MCRTVAEKERALGPTAASAYIGGFWRLDLSRLEEVKRAEAKYSLL